MANIRSPHPLNILQPKFLYNPEAYLKVCLGEKNADEFITVAIAGWVYLGHEETARKLIRLLPEYGLTHLIPTEYSHLMDKP